MDWVIPVRAGGAADELRYALRSVAENAPHDRIWLVGYRPAWARNVEHIPTRQTGSKYRNTTLAVRVACSHPEVSDPFVLANDDMFIVRPIERVPVLHRGRIADVERYYASRANGRYLRGMRQTRDLLVGLGHADPLCYELHIPMPVSKAGMLAALDAGRHLDVLHKRTAYGVLNDVGGAPAADVKVVDGRAGIGAGAAFASTMPVSWRGAAGRQVRARFQRPSVFELSRR